MKKTILACLVASLFVLSGCEDKALTEKLANAEKQIQQLTTEKAAMQTELSQKKDELNKLKQNQSQQKDRVPALRVEIVEIFNKAETVKHIKNQAGEFGSEETKINVFASTASTGIEWLDQLLIKALVESYSNQDDQSSQNLTQQNLIEKFQQIYNEFANEANEYKPFALNTSAETIYLGQRNNMVSFIQNHYSYTGGAHGVSYSRYLNIDVNKKALITLDDLISPTQQAKLKELLWERYTEDRRNENGEISTFVEKNEFEISKDFYFTENGISFVYPVYALGPYAEGEIKLELYFQQLNELLNKDYQRTQKDGFNLNPIEY